MFDCERHVQHQKDLMTDLLHIILDEASMQKSCKLLGAINAFCLVQLDLLHKLIAHSPASLLLTTTLKDVYKINYVRQQEYLVILLGKPMQDIFLPDENFDDMPVLASQPQKAVQHSATSPLDSNKFKSTGFFSTKKDNQPHVRHHTTTLAYKQRMIKKTKERSERIEELEEIDKQNRTPAEKRELRTLKNAAYAQSARNRNSQKLHILDEEHQSHQKSPSVTP